MRKKQIKKNGNKSKNIVIAVLVVILVILFCCFICNYYSEPRLESITVFGKDIPVKKGKHVYEIVFEKSGNYDECFPIDVKFSDGKAYLKTLYFVDGADEVYAIYSFQNDSSGYVAKKVFAQYGDYYFHVYLDKPLSLSNKCKNS